MIRLFDLHHAEARDLLARGVPVWLSFNPIEYHGPHLSLHNDALVDAGLTADIHARLVAVHPEWEPLAAASWDLGVGAVPGPGTQETPFPALRARVLEVCRSLVRLGARRVVLMTFHGAPLHSLALQAGVEALQAAGVSAVAPVHLLLRQFIDPEVERLEPALACVPSAEDREALRRGIRHDYHAGFGETSLALHYAPESVSPALRDVPPCPTPRPRRGFLAASRAAEALGRRQLAAELRFAAHGLGWHAVRPFPGYTGRPALARAEAGAEIARLLVDDFSEAILAVFEGRADPPEPIMPWLRAVSLGGRLPV